MLEVPIDPTFDSWRDTARSLIAQDVSPDQIAFVETGTDELFSPAEPFARPPFLAPVNVPREFVQLARYAAAFRDPRRWSLLYRLLWRLTRGEPHILEVTTDDDVFALTRMHKAVRRDAHKAKAFVRFRKVESDDGEDRFVAWHRPDHFVLPLVAPFFADRFATMRWTILTPDASVAWDLKRLSFGPGVPSSDAPKGDDLEAFWKTYYASIFNPARLKLKAMQKEMPQKHWPTLPEAALIPDLVRDAPARVEAMMAKARAKKASETKEVPGEGAACESTGSAADFLPARLTLPQLREAASTCKGCGIYCNATQTVFGQGPAHAVAMFVGEQPGDQEDRAGKPFVGPSGQLLDEALEAAGIPRDECYVTNAVKHFKFEPRGSRRIHAKPSAREVKACRPWLEAEIKVVKPKMIVCLGATAAQSLMGPSFRLTQHRGEALKTDWAPWLLATNHPSAILRVPDEEMRRRSREQFFADMKIVAKKLAEVGAT